MGKGRQVTDILIPLGNGSGWQNNELRYALRTIEQYGSGFDRLFIVGEKPDFLKNFIHIPYKEAYGPALNTLCKILHAFEKSDISDNVIFTYDDNYLIKPVNLSEYPTYWRRELSDKPLRDGSYWTGLAHTKKILDGLNKPCKDFSVHCPIILNRQKFLEMRPLWDKVIKEQQPIGVRALYCNYHNIEGVKLKDLKYTIAGDANTIEFYQKDRDVFSISDLSLLKGMDKYLEQRYPYKSRWEI